jgi:hypothetical protein
MSRYADSFGQFQRLATARRAIEVERMVQNAIGAENVTTTLEGPGAYPANVRSCAISGAMPMRSRACLSPRQAQDPTRWSWHT